MSALSVRLQADQMERLNHLAKVTNRPKTFYVKELFNRHFDDLEDIYLAEQRLEDIRAGKAKTISLNEMRESLDLDN